MEIIMKKRFLTCLMVLPMVLMALMTLTACGGDDDDNNGIDTAIGVHRIDVQFNDNVRELQLQRKQQFERLGGYE